jgi:hypothetical protein
LAPWRRHLMPSELISVRLSPALIAAIRDEAAARRLSPGLMVRRILQIQYGVE